jgi:ribosomal-protein-serine acetyltransferase
MIFRILVRKDLELRLPEEKDAIGMFRLIEENRGYLRQWLTWLDTNTSVSDTRRLIRTGLSQYKKMAGLSLGIYYKGQWIGKINLQAWEKTQRRANIGYWISKKFEGRGIVTASVKALLKYAFTELGINRIDVHCAIKNHRSRAIPERLGMKLEGKMRDGNWLYNHYVDLYVYSILAREWKKRQWLK